MREVKDENGKIWYIDSAATLAERSQNHDKDGVRSEEEQKLMYTPEGEFFIYTNGKKSDPAEGGVWHPYETVTPVSSDDVSRELEGGKGWKQIG